MATDKSSKRKEYSTIMFKAGDLIGEHSLIRELAHQLDSAIDTYNTYSEKLFNAKGLVRTVAETILDDSRTTDEFAARLQSLLAYLKSPMDRHLSTDTDDIYKLKHRLALVERDRDSLMLRVQDMQNSLAIKELDTLNGKVHPLTDQVNNMPQGRSSRAFATTAFDAYLPPPTATGLPPQTSYAPMTTLGLAPAAAQASMQSHSTASGPAFPPAPTQGYSTAPVQGFPAGSMAAPSAMQSYAPVPVTTSAPPPVQGYAPGVAITTTMPKIGPHPGLPLGYPPGWRPTALAVPASSASYPNGYQATTAMLPSDAAAFNSQGGVPYSAHPPRWA